jgi:hypothetical protein
VLALVLVALLFVFLRPKAPTVTVTPTPPAPAVARPTPPALPPPAPVAAMGPAAPAAAAEPAAHAAAGQFNDPVPAGLFDDGRVVDEGRRPVAGATVQLFVDAKVEATARTKVDGWFKLPEFQVKTRGVSYFRVTHVIRDGKGHSFRTWSLQTISNGSDEESDSGLINSSFGTIVLRDASPLDVRVTTGGVPLEGAEVWAEEDSDSGAGTEIVKTGIGGIARFEDVPNGNWTVFAKMSGRGAGSSGASIPSPGPVEVALSPRVLEIEAVDAVTGKPVEGVRFQVLAKYRRGDQERWYEPFPPHDPPPTDSAGWTRIADIGDGTVGLRPIHPGQDDPIRGTPLVSVDPGATSVRVPVAWTRTVRWQVVAGEQGAPPEGSLLVVGEERLARDPDIQWTRFEGRRERIENGEVVVEQLGAGPFTALARAPDGSLARLSVEAGVEKGPPVRFFAPRRLTVVVRDEDGKEVPDPVVLLTPEGEAVALRQPATAEGKTLFDHLYPAEFAICALARHDWGGAEVARVNLVDGDRTIEAVVGREFTAVLRFRAAGVPKLPAGYEVRLLTPGPDVHGSPHEEFADMPVEDPAKGEVRYRLRPHSPGKPVTLRITVPGRDPIRREAAPPAEKDGETVVEIDL